MAGWFCNVTSSLISKWKWHFIIQNDLAKITSTNDFHLKIKAIEQLLAHSIKTELWPAKSLWVCLFICLALAHFSAHSKSIFNCRSFEFVQKIYIFISLLLINFWSFLFLSHLHFYPIYNFFSDGCAVAYVCTLFILSFFSSLFISFCFLVFHCSHYIRVIWRRKKNTNIKIFRQSQKQEKKEMKY